MQSASDSRAQKFADVRRSENSDGVVWRITIWRMGGHINGSAQPYKILGTYKSSEYNVALFLDLVCQDIKFAPVPKMIDGRLFVYNLGFK